MSITCSATVSVPVNTNDIVKNCPTDKVPMFQVISGYDEFVVGEMVYLKDGHYHVCMTNERVGKKQISEVRFISYIDKRDVE